ncbi:MAG: alpha/beta hydrolase [Acinetobacter sp.]
MQTSKFTQKFKNSALVTVMAVTMGLFSSTVTLAADMSNSTNNFYHSSQVNIQKVTFKNQYNMNIVANLVIPKNFKKNTKASAIIIGHPMGAVKEQSSMLYAQKLAEQGFITLAIDLSFWGESQGEPRNLVSPEIYTEAFNAAVDYLGTQTFIDRNRIGVLGICGSGSFAISAAKLDPRLKAIATVAMYDMGSVTRNGLKHSQTLEQRKQMLETAMEQRYAEFQGHEKQWINYLPKQIDDTTDPIVREFYDFYRTPRGASIPKGQTLEQTQNRALSSEVRFVNFYPFNDIETISPRPMLFITGDQAHSKEFSEEAYKLAGQPKELYYVKGAGHVDLYDRTDLIPFDKLATFFKTSLN